MLSWRNSFWSDETLGTVTNTGKDLNVGTNGIDISAEPRLDEDIMRVPSPDRAQAPGPLDKASGRKHAFDPRLPEAEYLRPAGGTEPVETARDFALAPLVDKIAYGIARGLIVAVKELEQHIASETRKVGDAVDRRLDMLQTSLQDLSRFVGEQQSTNAGVQAQLQELAVGLHESDSHQAAEFEALRSDAREFSAEVSQRIDVTVSALQESDARQAADLAALQNETKTLSQSVSDRIDGLSKELSIQQEDIAALKAALCTFSSRVDVLVERLDRQADAVRSMYTAYSQRESELEQLVDGLARLRAQPTPLPTNGL
jgi:uncharacterized coiled-coil protein SlyX